MGELGWELYVPAEFAVGVYEDLMSAGEDLGVMNGGYYTIDSMRLEKGYRAFGRELTPDYNPVEAGLTFACKLKTDIPFLGREAVEQAKSDGPRRKMVSFVLESPEPMLWGGELVLRDGVAAGQVMSAAWGESLGACVGLAYVWDPDGDRIDRDWVKQGSYEIDINGISRAGLDLAPTVVRPGRQEDQGLSSSSRVLKWHSVPRGSAHDSAECELGGFVAFRALVIGGGLTPSLSGAGGARRLTHVGTPLQAGSGGADVEADHRGGRRRSGRLAGDRARPAEALRRRLPGGPNDIRRRGLWSCWPS